jgi:hypothetical protein
MKALLLLLVVVVFAGVAKAATVTTVRNGDMGNGRTWDTGSVPTAADDVVVEHQNDLPQGAVEYNTLTVNGTLATNGTTTLTVDYVVVSGTLHLEGSRTATDSLHIIAPGSAGPPKVVVDVTGSLIGSGSMTFDRLSADGANEVVFLRTGEDSEVAWGGHYLGKSVVSFVDLAPTAPAITVTCDQVFTDATHVRVTSGINPNFMYRVTGFSGNDVTLERGECTTQAGVAFTLGGVTAAEDSILVTTTTADVGDFPGFIVQSRDVSGNQVGVKQVYTANSFEQPATYDDWTLQLKPGTVWSAAEAGATSAVLLESIYEGVRVEFLRMPVMGADIVPTGAQQSGGIEFGGLATIAIAEFKHLQQDEGSDNFGIRVVCQEQVDFERVYLRDFWTLYPISYDATGTASGLTYNLKKSHLESNLKPYSSSSTNGHALNWVNAANTLLAEDNVLSGVSDDHHYIHSGNTSNRHILRRVSTYKDWGRGNFLDLQNSSVDFRVLVEHSRAFGSGSQGYTCTSGGTARAKLHSSNNLFTSCGQRYNRSQWNEDYSSGNTWTITDMRGFTSVNDTIHYWSTKGIWIDQSATNDGPVSVTGLLIERGGNPHLLWGAESTVSRAQIVASPLVPVDLDEDNTEPVTFTSCKFYNNLDRSLAFWFDGSPTKWGAGFMLNGTSTAHVTVTKCHFVVPFYNTGVAHNYEFHYFIDNAGNPWGDNNITITHNLFEAGVYVVNWQGTVGTGTLNFSNNVSTRCQHTVFRQTAGSSQDIVFNNNTILGQNYNPSGQARALIDFSNGGSLEMKHNILIQERSASPNCELLEIQGTILPVTTAIDWNILRSYSGFVANNGGAQQDCATFLASGVGSNNDCQDTYTTREPDLLRWMDLIPRLISVRDTISVAIDFIDDGATFATDLSQGDAGALPNLIDY